MRKISHLLCYAIVYVCKFCIHCSQHVCPTEIYFTVAFTPRVVLYLLTNTIFYWFAIQNSASVARSLCYSWATCWNKHSWHWRPAKILDANLVDFDQDIIDAATNQWHDHLTVCVHPSDGHFEHVLWNECSFISFIRTVWVTVNVIWCM